MLKDWKIIKKIKNLFKIGKQNCDNVEENQNSKRKSNKHKIVVAVKETAKEQGLSAEEVEIRKKTGLINKTKTGSSRSIAGIIFKEIFTYFNMIYMILTAILIYVGAYIQLTFLGVIIPNTLISIIQQIKSKRTVERLSLLVRSNAKVVRDCKETEVPTDEIVRDDIIKFSLGDQISADCIVLDGECKVNESMLTGESLPIKKNESDKLYAGSFVTSGTVYARAISVGAESYVQTLTAQAKRYKRPKSEILNALNSIIQIIGIAIIPIAIFLYSRTHEVVKTAGAIIGMIPSGMFLLTTIALAVSVIRLSKNATLVQELYCIEMLARVDTLAMDKTGTITDGTMKVSEITKIKSSSLANEKVNLSNSNSTLNTTVATTTATANAPAPKNKKGKNINKINLNEINEIIGNMLSFVTEDNPTSIALKNHFALCSTLKMQRYHAFSSDTKFFAVEFENAPTYFLGAPEYVCDLNKYKSIQKDIDKYAHKGERVLLLCEGAGYEDEKDFNKSLSRPLYLISLMDNIRQDAIETIAYFKENNVDLKVISGDNEVTVSEIAKRAGLKGAEKCISLQDKTDEEVVACANEYNVFGRVSPQQKELLIKSMKHNGHTVAMVGDGVNDILALREADCSVAIGAGSESAKNVSHLILVDSNFSHMKNVVGEGRRCINNLQCTSTMFLTKTFIAIILSIFCILTANNYPFSPNQLMVLEMFGIGLPGFFFALQPNKNLVKGHFLDSVLIKSFTQALTALLFVLPLYLLVWDKGFEPEIVETLIVLIVTANSLVVLLRIAYPYNAFRLAVSLSMVVLSVVAFLLISNVAGMAIFGGTFLYNYLGLTQLSHEAVVLLIVVLASLFPVQFTLSKLANLALAMRKALEERKKPKQFKFPKKKR